MSATGHPTVAAIDAAIVNCAKYASDHATGAQRYGWGWVAEAAAVARTLADVRSAVVESLVAASREAPGATADAEVVLRAISLTPEHDTVTEER